MAIIHLSTAVANAMLVPLKDAVDAGTGAGTIKIYTGTMPTLTTDAVTTQTLLGTLTCSDPCGTVASKKLTLASITQDSAADADGVAAWARMADSSGVVVVDFDVTTTGGGGVLQLNTTNIKAGGPIAITSFEFSL